MNNNLNQDGSPISTSINWGLRQLDPTPYMDIRPVGNGPVGGAGFYPNRPRSVYSTTINAFSALGGSMEVSPTPFQQLPGVAPGILPSANTWYQSLVWGPGINRGFPNPSI